MRTQLLLALSLTAGGQAAAVKAQLPPADIARDAVRLSLTAPARATSQASPAVRQASAVRPLAAAAVPPRTWTVRAGDTLASIAQRQGVTRGALIGANPGLDPQRALWVGQRLVLPAAPITRAGTSAALRPASVRVTARPPVEGRLTTPYRATHPGLDLAAPTGTPIRASLADTVTESHFDSRNGWGWTVVLDHGGGLTSRYSHNSANLVRVGARVKSGDVIARVGSTGNSSGAHVDYRVYWQGTPINPLRLQ